MLSVLIFDVTTRSTVIPPPAWFLAVMGFIELLFVGVCWALFGARQKMSGIVKYFVLMGLGGLAIYLPVHQGISNTGLHSITTYLFLLGTVLLVGLGHVLTKRFDAIEERRSAFTLIELLLVIGVIGVLAAIVVAAVSPKRTFIIAVDAKSTSAVRELERGILSYQIDKSTLPTSDTLPSGVSSAQPICRYGITSESCINIDDVVGEYIAKIPEDPRETLPERTGYHVYQEGSFVRVGAQHIGQPTAGIDIVTEDLISWWKLDDSAGDEKIDIANGYTGSLVAGDAGAAISNFAAPTAFTNTGSIEFTSANNPRIEIGQNPYRVQEFTYSAWVYPTASACNIVADLTNHANVRIAHFSGTFSNRITFIDETVSLAGPVSVNTWQHIAFLYDGAEVKFFINGKIVDSRHKTGTINYSGGSEPYLTIGNTTNPGFCPFNGFIDDFRVYSRGLGTSEIRRIASGKG